MSDSTEWEPVSAGPRQLWEWGSTGSPNLTWFENRMCVFVMSRGEASETEHWVRFSHRETECWNSSGWCKNGRHFSVSLIGGCLSFLPVSRQLISMPLSVSHCSLDDMSAISNSSLSSDFMGFLWSAKFESTRVFLMLLQTLVFGKKDEVLVIRVAFLTVDNQFQNWRSRSQMCSWACKISAGFMHSPFFPLISGKRHLWIKGILFVSLGRRCRSRGVFCSTTKSQNFQIS